MSTIVSIDFDDTSPVVSYYPFAETFGEADLLAGWAPFYTISGFQGFLGQTGNGTSYHVTSQDGAIFGLEFEATGITLLGNVSRTTYDIYLDGTTSPGALKDGTGILAQFDGLTQGKHRILLTAHPQPNPPGTIAFDRGILRVDTGLVNATVSSNAVNISSLVTSGSWSKATDESLPGTEKSFIITKEEGAKAQLRFTGSAITVAGTRDIDHGMYDVTLDNVTTRYDAKSGFRTATMLFFRAGLDSSVEHDLVISNAAKEALVITAVNVATVSGGTTVVPITIANQGLPTGTIVALSLAGGIVVLTIAAVVAFVLWQRRKHNRQRGSVGGEIRPHRYEEMEPALGRSRGHPRGSEEEEGWHPATFPRASHPYFEATQMEPYRSATFPSSGPRAGPSRHSDAKEDTPSLNVDIPRAAPFTIDVSHITGALSPAKPTPKRSLKRASAVYPKTSPLTPSNPATNASQFNFLNLEDSAPASPLHSRDATGASQQSKSASGSRSASNNHSKQATSSSGAKTGGSRRRSRDKYQRESVPFTDTSIHFRNEESWGTEEEFTADQLYTSLQNEPTTAPLERPIRALPTVPASPVSTPTLSFHATPEASRLVQMYGRKGTDSAVGGSEPQSLRSIRPLPPLP